MSPFPSIPRRVVGAAPVLCLAVFLAGPVAAQEPSPEPVSPLPSPVSPVPGVEPIPEPSPGPIDPRPEGTWTVMAFDAWGDGLVEPRQADKFTASWLPAGRLEGQTGCGTYLGGYWLEGESLTMRVISKGPDPCGPRRTQEAVDFSLAVEAVTTWVATETGLHLLDEGGAVRVILERPPEGSTRPLGDWRVLAFARPDGRLVEPLPDRPATLAFADDGTVAGSTGCRLFEGRYEIELDRIVIAPVDPVGLPCEGAERRQERRFLGALDRVVLWEVDETGLRLTDGTGEILVDGIAAVEDPAA